MKKYLTKKNIFYGIILITFIFLSVVMNTKHEFWADEANAWLLAQDLSIKDLIIYIHRDGHPILFHLIIKFFSLIGLKYKYFGVISILFSSLGIGLLLFKSKLKWYLKLLLPFTYFIFYQYTVVVRGYCLVLFLLSLVAILWKKRREKCVLFTFILFLLLSSEIYTFLIAGSIYLIFIIDYIKEYLDTKKHDKKYLYCLIFLFISFLLTTIYVYPRSSNAFNPSTYSYYLSDSFITPFNASTSFKIFTTMILVSFFTIIYSSVESKKRLEALIIILPTLLFMIFKYSNLWHKGIIFILLIFLIWIHELEEIKSINIFMVICAFIQIYYSINTCIYDYNNKYSSSYEIAQFIKKYDYKNLKIYGHTFYASEINPYFENNIYFNWNNYRFYYWDKNANYYHFKPSINLLETNNVDILIYYPYEFNLDIEKIKEKYDEYIFEASTYFQVSKYENMTCYVYVKKELNNGKEQES